MLNPILFDVHFSIDSREQLVEKLLMLLIEIYRGISVILQRELC